jgi:hypothetical protein
MTRATFWREQIEEMLRTREKSGFFCTLLFTARFLIAYHELANAGFRP